MRGQYRVWLPSITVGTSEAAVLTVLVPSDTIIELVRIEAMGRGSAASAVTWRLRRVTSGTPSLTGTVIVEQVDHNNTINPATTFGTGWSAAPGGYDDPIVAGAFEAYGGRDVIAASIQEAIARMGSAGSATRFELSMQAAVASTPVSLRLTFNE
ncbi:MAG: hypothetical protein NZ553_17065 [Caldilinea sp.]|nr:hypothetical protein [Caldilinea sp.]MDW8442192.1 hypothetical protein [Caldilineaceae bacterium]